MHNVEGQKRGQTRNQRNSYPMPEYKLDDFTSKSEVVITLNEYQIKLIKKVNDQSSGVEWIKNHQPPEAPPPPKLPPPPLKLLEDEDRLLKDEER